MSDRATLEALLARVLEGTGPDREIDGQLALLKGYTYEKRKGEKFPWWRRPDGFRISIWGDQNKPPPYTASLDAALTLLPEGYWWQIANGNRRHYDLKAGAELFFAGGPNRGDMAFSADAATPARALIAACIKARMEAQPSSDT